MVVFEKDQQIINNWLKQNEIKEVSDFNRITVDEHKDFYVYNLYSIKFFKNFDFKRRLTVTENIYNKFINYLKRRNIEIN